MILAVIPARGGSKRIPRKNIRSFCGKPIIAYSIEAALASGLFDRLVVSTDDQEIAEVARRFGAEVPFMRPNHLADDHTGTNDVVRHAIEWFDARREPPAFVCCIYATAPFVTPDDLRRGYETLLRSGKRFAFSATTFPFPIWRAIRRYNDGTVEPIFPEHIAARSQDLEEAYHDAGQFYWGEADAFRKNLPVFARHSVAIVLPRHQVQDIDTAEDWDVAEQLYRIGKGS